MSTRMPTRLAQLPPDLLAALSQLDDTTSVALLLEDLLTPAEVRSVGERWLIVKRIAAGERQRAVRDALGVSITTVNRGAKQYRDGCGGFDLAFDVLRRTRFPDPRQPAPTTAAAAAAAAAPDAEDAVLTQETP